jgi:hypothetical protein
MKTPENTDLDCDDPVPADEEFHVREMKPPSWRPPIESQYLSFKYCSYGKGIKL